MAEDVGTEDFAEQWLVDGERRRRRQLRLGQVSHPFHLEFGPCHRLGQILQNSLDGEQPVDAYEAAEACVQDQGIQVGYLVQQAAGQRSNGEERAQVDIFLSDGDTLEDVVEGGTSAALVGADGGTGLEILNEPADGRLALRAASGCDDQGDV